MPIRATPTPFGSPRRRTVEALLAAHFRRAHEGDYIGLLAYLDRSPEHIAALQEVRTFIRDRKHLATVLGFGPRYLHSTGQAYKGGPNAGVFLEITAQPTEDIAVPGRHLQLRRRRGRPGGGDLEVLAERGRRVLRLDLGADVEAGLRADGATPSSAP